MYSQCSPHEDVVEDYPHLAPCSVPVCTSHLCSRSKWSCTSQSLTLGGPCMHYCVFCIYFENAVSILVLPAGGSVALCFPPRSLFVDRLCFFILLSEAVLKGSAVASLTYSPLQVGEVKKTCKTTFIYCVTLK